MRYTVGCVPYLNARPLTYGLDSLGVDVTYDVPSRLPGLLDSEEAEAILVSSIEALQRPSCRVAGDVSISSFGPVMSVRLFSRVPIEQIESLALDQSSLTSNALAQIILAERYGVRPRTTREAPNLKAMLATHDAGILIGDNGMREPGESLHILDLGEEWHQLTGLPFVWAVWVGRSDFPAELAGKLLSARQDGMCHVDEIIAKEVAAERWPESTCRRYLTEVMNYELTEDHLAGLREYGRLLVKLGLLQQITQPVVVSGQHAHA